MFTKKYYAYSQVPVDFRFGSVTLEEIVENKTVVEQNLDETKKSIIDFRNRALGIIKEQLGWKDDDMRHECFFFVPGENEMLIGYIMKQSNNGTTYVVSPVQPNDPSVCGKIIEIEKQ